MEGFSATHSTLVTILHRMVLCGFVSFHRIDEACRLPFTWPRLCLRLAGVFVKSNLRVAGRRETAPQHGPHQRVDFTLSLDMHLHSDTHHF
jgi:hypothetical protein